MTDDHQASEQTETKEQLRREVEQRKRTAHELAVFQQFTEASGRGCGIADMDGRIVYVNPALCRLVGEERPEDLIGKPISAYHPEGYQRKVEEEIKPALTRQPYWEGEQTLLGGRSAIRSRRGQGTRIVVELPLVPSRRTGP